MIPDTARGWMAVLWPSFIGAAIVELLVFAAFDPATIQLIGFELHLSREGAYTSAFVLFWFACTVATLMTWNLLRPSDEVNRRLAQPATAALVPDAVRTDAGARDAAPMPQTAETAGLTGTHAAQRLPSAGGPLPSANGPLPAAGGPLPSANGPLPLGPDDTPPAPRADRP